MHRSGGRQAVSRPCTGAPGCLTLMTSAAASTARFRMPIMTNGAAGATLSNSQPPAVEVTRIPTAPQKLNAATTEIAVRASAHVYGGGVYNLSPGSVGEVPVVDVRRLSAETLQHLENVYRHFLHTGGQERVTLHAAVLQVLDVPTTFLATLQTALEHMQHLSNTVLEPVETDAEAESVWPEELRLL